MSELIDNAFKFSQKGNDVSIRTKIQDGNYFIFITDQGNHTIADSLVDLKPFQKNNTVPNNPGIGLGLAIADLLIKHIGGTLNFKNNTPCGLETIISFPIPIDEEATLRDH